MEGHGFHAGVLSMATDITNFVICEISSASCSFDRADLVLWQSIKSKTASGVNEIMFCEFSMKYTWIFIYPMSKYVYN